MNQVTTETAPAPIAAPAPTNGQPLAVQAAPIAGASRALAPSAIAPDDGDAISAFASKSNFENAWRMAVALSKSTMVPPQYQGEAGVSNCLVGLELASRVSASVFMVMQNLDVIHGRPGWRAKFLIATVNSSGKFTPLRFRWEGQPGTDSWGCRAVARSRIDNEECVGALITIALAKAEGWYSRNGSKWKTMPEQMLIYRSASFWTNVYAPELSIGMSTAEEIVDTHGIEVTELPPPPGVMPGNSKALEAALLQRGVPLPAVPEVDIYHPDSAVTCVICGKKVDGECVVTRNNDGSIASRHPGCSPFGAATETPARTRGKKQPSSDEPPPDVRLAMDDVGSERQPGDD